jgi:hypothetical protein
MAKERQVAVRVSEEDYRTLMSAARRDDVPAAQIIRRGLRRELERLTAGQKRAKR